MKKQSLRRYLARLAFLSTIPVLLVVLYIGYYHTRTIRDVNEAAAKDMVGNLTIAIDQRIESLLSGLRMLSLSPLLDDQERWPEFYASARGYLDAYGAHIILADTHMQMLLNTRLPYGARLPKLPTPKGHAAAPEVLGTGMPSVGDSFMGPIANQLLLAAVVPVLREGRVKYLLLAQIEARQFQAQIDALLIPPTWAVRVIDSKGDPLAERISRGLSSSHADRTRVRSFSAEITRAHWRVILDIPNAEYLLAATKDVIGWIVALLLAVIASHYAGEFYGKKLAASVGNLLSKRIDASDVTAISEIGDVHARILKGEERFRRLFEVAPIPLGLIGNDGLVLEVNDRWKLSFGYSREDIATVAAWWQLAYPDPDYRHWAVETWEDAVQHAREGKADRIEPHDYRVTCKNGEVLAMEITGTFLGDELLAAFFDVTERKRAESELFESERKYRALFENMTSGFVLFEVVLDDQGIPIDLAIIAANEGFESTTGLKVRDVIGKCLTKVLPGIESDAADWIGTYGNVALSGESRQFEQGSELLGVYYSITAYQARAMQCAVLFVDISERKRAERTLATNTDRLRNLHLIDQAILQAVDPPESIAQDAIVHARDLLQCQWISVVMLDSEGQEAGVIAAIGEEGSGMPAFLAEGIQSSMEAPIKSSLGQMGVLRIGWNEPRAIPREEQDIASEVARQISIAIEHARLLRETKRYAEELEGTVRVRTAQLEHANQEMEAFTYSVSHDLRAPLRAMDGFSHILEEGYSDRLDQEGRRLLGVISSNAGKMDKLIGDLLDLSKITRSEMRTSSIDMRMLASEACSELAPIPDGEGFAIEVGELPAIDGDASLLRQVWLNLIGNAYKYSMKSQSRRIEIASFAEGPDQVYSVKDQGAGFEPEYAGKLFTPFHRLHKSADFEGTGIGLAIVQRIVSRHGGRAWAESSGPGKGASFFFSLPRQEPG